MAAKDAPKDAPNDAPKTTDTAPLDAESKLEEKIETTVEAVKKGKYDFTKINILSLVSLSFSVIGGALPAIILGHISLAQIKKTAQDGRIMAIIAVVLGYLQIAIWVIGGIAAIVMAIVGLTQGIPFSELDGFMQNRWSEFDRGEGGPQGFGPGMMGDNR